MSFLNTRRCSLIESHKVKIPNDTVVLHGLNEFSCEGFCRNIAITVVDSRPARSAGRVKKNVASKPLKFLESVTKGIYYHFKP